MAEGQRHATRSLSALAEGVGPARGRWCRPMGTWAGKRQRPCANMDKPRSLDQSCVNHEFIKSKPEGQEVLGCFPELFCQDPPSVRSIATKNDEPSAVRSKHGQTWSNPKVRFAETRKPASSLVSLP